MRTFNSFVFAIVMGLTAACASRPAPHIKPVTPPAAMQKGETTVVEVSNLWADSRDGAVVVLKCKITATTDENLTAEQVSDAHFFLAATTLHQVEKVTCGYEQHELLAGGAELAESIGNQAAQLWAMDAKAVADCAPLKVVAVACTELRAPEDVGARGNNT